MHYPYEAFLNGTGLTVRPFRIQWYTTALNRMTIKWANSYPKLFTRSFDLGVLTSIVLLPAVFIWHLLSLYYETRSDTAAAATLGRDGEVTPSAKVAGGNTVELELMLPGINLPLDEIGYYITALAICSVVHEMGHAFAAVLEDIPITGFGFYILLAFPIAYTELPTDQINGLQAWRKLRVLCAGIWHNVVLAAMSFAALSLLPMLLLPIYSVEQSVIVTSIKRDSPLIGDRGLAIGDIITQINDCHVTNVHTWFGCLVNSIKNPPAYCIPSAYVLDHDESVPVYHTNEGVTECCDQHNAKTMCFEYMTGDSAYGLIELPQFMCLNVRNTIEHSLDYCHQSSGSGGGSGRCTNSFCIKPMMNNATTLMRIKRDDGKTDVMFIGHPSDLAFTMKVSGFVPKTVFFNANAADGVSLLLKYVVVFSLGLAVVNVIPCFYFDGYHITNTVTNILLQPLVPERSKRECIGIAITSMGTVFFVITLLRSIWNSFIKNAF